MPPKVLFVVEYYNSEEKWSYEDDCYVRVTNARERDASYLWRLVGDKVEVRVQLSFDTVWVYDIKATLAYRAWLEREILEEIVK